MSQGERLTAARIEAGFEKAADAISRFGFVRPTYFANEADRASFSYNTAKKYARAFGVNAQWLYDGTGLKKGMQVVKAIPRINGLPIRYRVQAGIWEEVFENHSYSLADYGTAPFYPMDGIPLDDQWAEEIIGDSVNRKYPDGTIIHVRKFHSMSEELPVGKFVVIQHYKHGLAKRTVKLLSIIDGKPVAIGYSTDERWNVPVHFGQEPEDGETAEIDAVVLRGMII